MSDQANKLRDIIRQRMEEQSQHVPFGQSNIETPLMELLQGTTQVQAHSRVISITSGKGGVGKTNFTVSLACSLATAGKRVAIIDADLGLANIEVIFGVMPKMGFADIIKGNATIAEVMTTGPMGISFVSGGSGLRNMANLGLHEIERIIQGFASLDTLADFVLIDTGAGISQVVTGFVLATSESLVVTTPEPPSISDAYGLIKSVREAGLEAGAAMGLGSAQAQRESLPSFKLVVNRVETVSEGKDVFDKFQRACGKFLQLEIENLGTIPYDHNMVRSVKAQKPIALAYPNSPAAVAIDSIAKRLLYEGISSPQNQMGAQMASIDNTGARGMKSFAKKLVGIFGK